MPVKELTRILYVEDEEDIRAIAKIALEQLGGFTVKFCSSGREAIETAAEFKPDLFLLDVMMPEMDGPTTLKELRKNSNLKNIPAIFMTAKIQPKNLEEYKQEGNVIDIISKPFDPIELPELLKKSWNNQKV